MTMDLLSQWLKEEVGINVLGSLESHFASGYAFGELLDIDGPIGGLNFQAAFATADLAARHASSRQA